MKDDKIVVRCKDKKLFKGRIYNFNSEMVSFQMRLISGESVRLNVDDVKAIFMVKDYDGNKDYRYVYKDVLLWDGLKIKISFHDKEVMIGYIPYHINSSRGFFVTPADSNGNNKKVFVMKSAIKAISYL